MSLPVLPTSITDADVHARTVERFRARGISLPTFAELQSINYLSPGCPVSPCIDPTLLPVGPSLSLYWSSINADNTHAKALGFTPSGTCDCPKTVPNYVRAVRDTLGPPAFP